MIKQRDTKRTVISFSVALAIACMTLFVQGYTKEQKTKFKAATKTEKEALFFKAGS